MADVATRIRLKSSEINIRVTVVSIRGNQIRLGIEAPGDVPIYREELLRALQAREVDPISSRELVRAGT